MLHYLALVDPDGGLAAGALTALKGFLLGTVGVSLITLVLAGAALHMGVRWLQKGRSEGRWE